MRRVRSSLLLLGFLAVAANAQPHPNLERGFDPNTAFAVSDLDQVNLQNGNLSLTLPLGKRYAGGGNLDFGLTLVYNSKAWDFVEQYDGASGETASEAVPDRLSNAGIGWAVSLGRLLDPDDPENEGPLDGWIYVSPDQAQHSFFEKLHVSDDESGTDPTNRFTYTRDSSYLRMFQRTSTLREIQQPNGTVHVFSRYSDPTGGPNGRRWRLTAMRDAFGNQVTVAYLADVQGHPYWELTDDHGRQYRVFFRNKNAGAPGFYGSTLASIAVPGVGTSSQVYTFTYVTVTLDKPTGQTLASNREVAVQLLEKVTLPDGSDYKFDYQTRETGYDNGHSRGAIRSMRLPTLGRVKWTFGLSQLPIDGCSWRSWFNLSSGVVTREIQNQAGGVIASWNYERTASAPPVVTNAICPQPRRNYRAPSEELKVTVTTPEKDKTAHYFSVYPGTSTGTYSGPFQKAEGGLPLTRLQTDATGTRFLSSEVFDCDAAGNACVRQRSSYTAYQMDGPMGVCNEDGSEAACVDRLRRPVTERVVYHDDANAFADTEFQLFDGFGNFRRVRTGGNFGAADVRETFTDYNPGVTQWAVTWPWVLGTYKERWVKEGTATARSTFCFEGATGFLKRQRNYKRTDSATPDAADVVAVYEKDADGEVVEERWYGGDAQAVGTGTDLCSLALPAQEAYRLAHTYHFSVRATSRYLDANGLSVGGLVLDRTIDRSGLVKSQRDPAGVATVFTYDAMLRPYEVKPAEDAWTRYSYKRANVEQGSLPELQVDELPNGGGTTALTTQTLLFDALGRLVTEQRRQPGGGTVTRTTSYTPMGAKGSVSEWRGATAVGSTQYLDYDPFGRPREIRPPDGVSHRVLLTYFGVRGVDRRTRIGTSVDAGGSVLEEEVLTSEVYDRQGRLYRLKELSRPGSVPVVTTYLYHVTGKLAQVTNDADSQRRSFFYDGRGFLGEEKHPELGLTGQGSAIYRYDALGNTTERREGAVNGPRHLLHERDRAGRLFRVREASGSRWHKEYAYGTGATEGNRSMGKLISSVRHNWIVPPWGGGEIDVTVTETRAYGGKSGRVSGFGLALSTGQSFSGSQKWDQQGQLEELTYPRCQHAACAGIDPVRKQLFTYDQGYLTAVPGFASGLLYHPNGLVRRVAHTNGVRVDINLESNGMVRPALITTTGVLPAGNNWSSGSYRYDGAGNVVKIGADTYVYDRVSRLATAAFTVNGAVLTQGYTRDAHGNLTQQITNGQVQTFAIDPLTNRLQASPQVAYDEGGNLRQYGAANYTFDPFNMLETHGNKVYLYTAADERVYVLDWQGSFEASTESWALRGAGTQVLRELTSRGNTAGLWSWDKDYVYRGAQLLASVAPAGVRHYTLDHLGTPRLVTDANATRVGYHAYYPFGQEATNPAQNDETMKFTGHEKDANGPGTADDLDYMHARYSLPGMGRFLSPDRLLGSPGRPQSWNRYAYTMGNPLKYVDPNGQCSAPAGLQEGQTGICIEAFIASERIGGVGFGDGRGFEGNDPSATARISYKMIVDNSTGIISDRELKTGKSEIFVRGFGFEGTTTHSIGVARSEVTGKTYFSMTFSGRNGLGAITPHLGNIDFHVSGSVDSEGNVEHSGTTKAFPSVAGYAYKLVQGELIIVALFEKEETEPEALNGPQNVPLGSQEVER